MKTTALAALAALLFAAPAFARCHGGQTASWYGEPQRVASGGRLDPRAMTCAHRTLPFGTLLQLDGGGGREAHCTVNDRGPNARTGCLVDVTPAVAAKLGMLGRGIARVTLTVVRRGPG